MEVNRSGRGFGKLLQAARRVDTHFPAHLPPVLVFTDPKRSAHPIDLACEIPCGWGLVYRHFGAEDREEIAADLAKLSKRRHFRLLIGADPELAFRIKADGVHWPERLQTLAARSARHFKINTLAAHQPSQVLGPQPLKIDARVLSTVFPSMSPSAKAPIGALKFAGIARKSETPLYGLGGVTAYTALRLANHSGMAGVGTV